MKLCYNIEFELLFAKEKDKKNSVIPLLFSILWSISFVCYTFSVYLFFSFLLYIIIFFFCFLFCLFILFFPLFSFFLFFGLISVLVVLFCWWVCLFCCLQIFGVRPCTVDTLSV